jgi:hypothetical protein
MLNSLASKSLSISGQLTALVEYLSNMCVSMFVKQLANLFNDLGRSSTNVSLGWWLWCRENLRSAALKTNPNLNVSTLCQSDIFY